MWVADTEFRCAAPILDAIQRRTAHGVFGYTHPNHYRPANDAIKRWLSDKHDWPIKPEWIVWMPGVVPAFNLVCQAYCQPGDKVLIQTPNYPPLLAAPALNGLQRVDIATLEVERRYTLDFAQLERAASDPKCKLFILCNPMNPVGSVLTDSELATIAQICQRHDVLLCSDEIHCDLVLDENAQHIPAGRQDALTDNSITLMAASKTFNIAGLGAAFAIIPNVELRRRFNAAAQGIMPWVHILGLVATEAAFTQCDDWYQDLLAYLRTNRDNLVAQINRIDGLRLLPPQATFLAWIDGSGLGVDSPQRYFEALGVGPSPGADFGDKHFVRINFGCPQAHLQEAIKRLVQPRH